MKQRFTKLLAAFALLVGLTVPMGMWGQYTYEVTNSIAVGDVVVLVNFNDTYELTGISSTSTKYGIGTSFTGSPSAAYPLTVETGNNNSGFAFKTTDNKYLTWTSGNSLNVATTKSDNTSWTVSFNEGVATITNVATTTRSIRWNNNSGQYRFACYENQGQQNVKLYKRVSSGTTITNLSCTGTPNKTTYEAGESFDPTGLTVTATYSDNTTADVTASVVWTPDPLTTGTTSVTGTYSGLTVTVDGITVTALVEPDIVLNKNNSPFTSTSGSNTSTGTITLDGIEYQNYGGYIYNNYLSINRSINGYLGNNTELCGGINKIVVDYNSGGASYFTMYEGATALAETTTVEPSSTGTGKVTYTFSGNNGFFKFKLTTTGTYCNINSISIYLGNCGIYRVNYNANGATSGNVPVDNTEYDDNNNTVTVAGNTGNLVKTGHTWSGWCMNEACIGTVYGPAYTQTFTITENTTLFAKWTPNTHTVTLPANDNFGSYTMSATNPVAYGTEVTLTYTPAAGYEYYVATWSMNGNVISGNKFNMPDNDVTVTVSLVEKHSFDIDFESDLTTYADWEFNKISRTNSNTAHGGSYYGSNSANNGSASITTKNKVANPGVLSFYVKRTSNNTNSATWYVNTSTDGSTWTQRGSQDATTEDWTYYEINLSSYPDSYVQIAYNGNTAIRAIDDISLAYTPAASYALSVATVDHGTITATAGTAVVDEGQSSDVESGIMVTLAASPEENYQLASWSVYKTGEASTIVEVANNQFEMPAYPVTVSATFNEICTLTYSVNGVETNVTVVKGTTVTLANPEENIPYGFDFIGWTTNPTQMADANLVSNLTMNANQTVYAVFGKSNVIEITRDYFDESYSSEKDYTICGFTFAAEQVASYTNTTFQFKKGEGFIYNKDAFVDLVSIVATQDGTYRPGMTLKVGDGVKPTEGTPISSIHVDGTMVDTYTLSGNSPFIYMENKTDYMVRYSSIILTFSNVDPTRYTRVYTKEIAGYNNSQYGYTLIASPIDNVDPANVTGMTEGNFDLYRFNESAELEWENWKQQDGNHYQFNLERGKGYLYAHKTNVTLAFAGTPVQGTTFDVTLSNSGTEYQGMNLVGNPFGQTAYIDRDFFVMNAAGSGFIQSSGAIAPMQGIIVDAANGTTLTFTTEAPSNGGGSKVALNLSRNRGDVIDRAIVRFGEGSQLHKFQLRENSTKVYFTEGNQDFAVVRSQKAQGEMPVNFKAEENGTYTLSVNTEEMELNYLHLIDNMTGMDVDLLQTPSYTFDATTNDYASRFRLVFSANGMNENGETETFAFYSNGNWVVGNEGEATLQVIDVNGRIVSNETINGTVATSINATPGVYMLRLVNGNEVKTQKIVVK